MQTRALELSTHSVPGLCCFHTLKRTDGASKTMFHTLKRKRVLRGREVIGFYYGQNRLEVDMELSKINTPKDLFSLLKESQQRAAPRNGIRTRGLLFEQRLRNASRQFRFRLSHIRVHASRFLCTRKRRRGRPSKIYFLILFLPSPILSALHVSSLVLGC